MHVVKQTKKGMTQPTFINLYPTEYSQDLLTIYLRLTVK